jgi:hypothetical protein
MRKQLALLVLILTLAVAQEPRANDPPKNPGEFGMVCVLPNSPEPPTRISPGGEYNPATLTIRIDKRPPLPWPHKASARIENLALNDRHLLVLTSDGKRIQSLWFRFSDFKDPKLCIYFDGYQGVQLGDKHSTFWCKCK